MRVGYVCADPGVPVYGAKGASIHAQAILTELVRRGAQVELLTPRPGGEPPAALAAVRVHRLDLDGGRDPAERERAARRCDAGIADLLDDLHREAPLDLVYERYSLWGRSASAWSRRQGVPHVLEVNAPLPLEQARHRALSDADAADHVARAALTDAGVVVCVSDGVAAWARGQRARSGGVHTVANGVDTARIRRAPFRADPNPFTIGFIGTLKPWHGVADLVDAVAVLHRADPAYRLLLVGDGPERDHLARRIGAAGLDDVVELAGQVAPTEVAGLLQRMDVGVAPYPALDDFYFSPLKVYEYLAAGLPVVATDVGDLADLVDESVGLVVPPGDPVALAAGIAALRADPGRRSRLAARARRVALERHGWGRVLSDILDLAEVTHGAPKAAVTA